MLKRLYIDNFRCLTGFEMRPDRVAVLVGPNGSGKSAVFDALRALQGLATVGATVDQHFHPLSRTRWDTRPVQQIEIDFQEPDGPLFQYALSIRHDEAKRTSFVDRERLTADRSLLYEVAAGEVRLFGDQPTPHPLTSFPFDSRRSFLPVLEARPDHRLISTFKRWLAGVWMFALRPSDLEWHSMAEAEAIDPTGRNFVSWYRSLIQEWPDVAEKLRKSLQPVVPGLEAIRLSKMSADARLLTIDCSVSGRPFTLGISELSDGQRCLLVLYTVLHSLGRRTSLLVFDEPDNYLSEPEIQPWLSQMREATVEANLGTLLVISHHPQVIDYLAADQALRLWRADNGPTRVEEILPDRETGLTASEWLRLGGTSAE